LSNTIKRVKRVREIRRWVIGIRWIGCQRIAKNANNFEISKLSVIIAHDLRSYRVFTRGYFPF